jgi:glyoxylase-like metal-dependent hydrolase (beta-lactamase superfamily II)
MRSCILTRLMIVAGCCIPMLAGAQQGEREIGRLNGDVYWARDFDLHLSTFMVTSEGIVVADPIGFEFSTWLKQELSERFDVPVRYVVYSHKDWDHASGGAVFADTAQFVGQENMSRHLGMPPATTPLPQAQRAADANGNGRIEQAEARGGLQNNFRLYDADRDGALTGAEIVRGPLADVRAPDITFSDRLTLTLGGKHVELIHHPIEHADDNALIYYPDDDSIMVVDFVLVNRVPFGALAGEIDAARAIEQLDFEYFVPGHGQIGTRADLIAHRQYREDLRAAVAAGVLAGRSVDELRASIKLEDYADWEFFSQWGPDNVSGMYGILTAK